MFPVLSLLAVWLTVLCFASGNAGVVIHLSCLAYCMVIAKLRFDDQQLTSAWMHLGFSLWLVFLFFQRIACLPTTVLFFNGQLALEGPPAPVNIRPRYLLTSGEEHLARRVRLAEKRGRARAYELLAVEQGSRAAAQAAEEQSRKTVLARLQSVRAKERQNSFRLFELCLEPIRQDILHYRLDSEGDAAERAPASKADGYHPPRPDDLNEPQSDTDSSGSDGDSSDDESHTPIRLRSGKIRTTKTVTRVAASSFQRPATRWNLPPFFPLQQTASVGSGTSPAASSSPPSTKQQETPATSPGSPKPASSASSRRHPKPASSASSRGGPTPASSGVRTATRFAGQTSKSPAAKPTIAKAGGTAPRPKTKVERRPKGPANNGPFPIDKPAATPAAKPIEKEDGEGSVARVKEASRAENGTEQGLVSAGWREGRPAAPEVDDDYEDPPEWRSDDDTAKVVPSETSAEPSKSQLDSGYETDVEMDPELPGGCSVPVDSSHDADNDVEMDPELPGGRSGQVDSGHDADKDVEMDPELPGGRSVQRTSDESMDIDTAPAEVASQGLDRDMDVDVDEDDALVEAMQRLDIAESDNGSQPNTLTPSTSAPQPSLSGPPSASSSHPAQPSAILRLRRNDAGHHCQTPHSSAASSSTAVSSSAASSAATAASSSAVASFAASSAASSSAASSSAASSSAASSSSAPSRTPGQQRDSASLSPPRQQRSSWTMNPPAAPPRRRSPTHFCTVDSTDEEREFCSEHHPAAELCENPWCPEFSVRRQHWHVNPQTHAAFIASMRPGQNPSPEASEPEKEEASDKDVKGKGKGKEKGAPPDKPEKDKASGEDDKDDEGSAPPKIQAEPTPSTLAPPLPSPLSAPTAPAPAPTSSPVFVPPPAAPQDLSTPGRALTAADLPGPCSSQSCRWTMRHWHINSSREVSTTEKQALTALRRKLDRKAKETCAPPPKPDKKNGDEDDDDNAGPAPPPKSGSEHAGPASHPAASDSPLAPSWSSSAPSSDVGPRRHNAFPTPICDPENDLLDAEMDAYFAAHGPYAPTPTPTPAARVIKPMRSAKSKATISRLKVANELPMTEDDVLAVWEDELDD